MLSDEDDGGRALAAVEMRKTMCKQMPNSKQYALAIGKGNTKQKKYTKNQTKTRRNK